MRRAVRLGLSSVLLLNVAAAADCDRECLRGFVTQYLNALMEHQPSALPAAPGLRFTEDEADKRLGEGLWKDVSRLRPYRLDILDTRQGVAASFVIVEAGGAPALLALRLKIAGGKISEIETQVTRGQQEGRLFNIAALDSPTQAMTAMSEPSQRSSRQEAIRLAEFYPAGLKIGSFVSVDAPFAADAYRLENGVATAGRGCARAGCENIKTQDIMKHPAITYQVKAVDEDAGIVLLHMNFGDTGSYGPGNALFVWEAFKVYGGQIHGVEAFMKVLPANTRFAWQ